MIEATDSTSLAEALKKPLAIKALANAVGDGKQMSKRIAELAAKGKREDSEDQL